MWVLLVACLCSFVVVQSLSRVQLSATPWLQQTSLPCPSPSRPAFSLSQHQGLFSESALPFRWPKYWSFSFSISPSNEYSGLISFGIDWFDLLTIQETLKSLLQHYNSKTSVLQRSAFFMVQLSHSCMTTGKTITFKRIYLFFSWRINALHNFVLTQRVKMEIIGQERRSGRTRTLWHHGWPCWAFKALARTEQ